MSDIARLCAQLESQIPMQLVSRSSDISMVIHDLTHHAEAGPNSCTRADRQSVYGKGGV